MKLGQRPDGWGQEGAPEWWESPWGWRGSGPWRGPRSFQLSRRDWPARMRTRRTRQKQSQRWQRPLCRWRQGMVAAILKGWAQRVQRIESRSLLFALAGAVVVVVVVVAAGAAGALVVGV